MGGYPSVLVGLVSVCHFKMNEQTYSRPRLRESTYHLGQRRSMLGKSLPAWLLQPGTVLLPRFIRNKDDPLVEEVELLLANPSFAQVRFPSGRESSVSTNNLAPLLTDVLTSDASTRLTELPQLQSVFLELPQLQQTKEASELEYNESDVQTEDENLNTEENNNQPLRRSSGIRKPSERYGDVITH